MPSTTYNCPNCENENKLILLGNDYGIFDRICKKCSSEIEVEINEEQSVSKVRSKKNTVNHFQEKKAIPKDSIIKSLIKTVLLTELLSFIGFSSKILKLFFFIFLIPR